MYAVDMLKPFLQNTLFNGSTKHLGPSHPVAFIGLVINNYQLPQIFCLCENTY